MLRLSHSEDRLFCARFRISTFGVAMPVTTNSCCGVEVVNGDGHGKLGAATCSTTEEGGFSTLAESWSITDQRKHNNSLFIYKDKS